MILDIATYQGVIDWKTVFEKNELDGIILRSTVKSGALDSRFMENYNGILQNCNQSIFLDVYKFSYALTFEDAIIEVNECIGTLKNKGIHFDRLWLDLENIGNSQHTSKQASAVISAYLAAGLINGVNIGLYANYNYLRNVIPKAYANSKLPIWAARYNTTMGDVSPFKPIYWQYTSKGRIEGINTDVDISKIVL